VHTVQATMGARLSSIQQVEVRNTGTTIEMRSALSETEDVGLTEAILDLKGQEAAYSAALSVTARTSTRAS
jgi:flagellin-like hook-associated protein FlgL